jgi:glutathione S-transferase
MKLYDGGRAPNPRRTRIFLAEKGIKLPMEQVDIGAMAQMSPTYAAKIRSSGSRRWCWTMAR